MFPPPSVHEQGSNNVIAVLATGSGGRAGLCSALDESMVAYCALRLGTASAPRFHRCGYHDR